ncbi:MAG: NifU family protein [Microbacteriaceae bacterium]|nr:NifU family protein [Microbacteriaceae bacterium]
MNRELDSVVISKEADGSFVAFHAPSGKKTTGATMDDARDAMRKLLGMDEEGAFTEPLTSDRFSGVARDVARFLEGPVSDMLKFHSGFARLEAFEAGIAHIRLGGGCEGCPSSLITLLNGVRSQLQDEFGEDQVVDVVPVD